MNKATPQTRNKQAGGVVKAAPNEKESRIPAPFALSFWLASQFAPAKRCCIEED
jgi:hypothetical protein